MRRGEIWIGAGGAEYTGKPRPMAILQSDRVANFKSVVVCPFTSSREAEGALRPLIQPSTVSGLDRPSWLMVDKLSAIARAKLDKKVGELSPDEMDAVAAALADLLGLDR